MNIDWQVAYVSVTIIAIVLLASLAAFGWRFRRADGSRHFLFLIVMGLAWSILVLIMAVAPATQTIFWLKLKYIFTSLAPVGLFLYSLRITGLMPSWQRPLIGALFVLPVVTQLVIWTPGTFHWMIIDIRVDRVGILSYISDIRFGPFYWVAFLQAYALILLSIGMLAMTAYRANRVVRGQLATMALAACAPLIANFLLVTKIAPREYDPMPFGVLVMSYLLWWAIMRYRMVDLLPVARNRLMDVIDNGVLATDGAGRIIDCNAAMARLLRHVPNDIVGQPLASVFERLRLQVPAVVGLDELSHIFYSMMHGQSTKTAGGQLVQIGGRHFSIHATPLPTSGANTQCGQLLVLDDVSERIETEAKLTLALAEVKTLRGLLPMCTDCKSVKDGKGRWQPIDEYIYEHSEADLSHTLCPSCMLGRYPAFGGIGRPGLAP